MKKIYYSEDGFTLVEVIVAMAIASMMIIALMQLTSTGNKMFTKSELRSRQQMDVRLAATHITEKLRFADFNIYDNEKKLIKSYDDQTKFIKYSESLPEQSSLKPDEKILYIGEHEGKGSLILLTKDGKTSLLDKEISLDKTKSFFQWESKKEVDNNEEDSIKKDINRKPIEKKDLLGNVIYGNLVSFQITEKESDYAIKANVRLLNAKESDPDKEYIDGAGEKKVEEKYQGIRFFKKDKKDI